MILSIGVMIGAYIIAKMLWVIGLKGDSAPTAVTKIFCVIAILVSVFGIATMLTAGIDI